MSNILIVLSAAATWTRADGSAYESGVWAEEFVVMDETFRNAGCTVDIATPGGVRATIDPHSMNLDVIGQDNVDHFQAYLESIEDRMAAPLMLADVVTSRYDAVVIPGGHGPVEDLYKDPTWAACLPKRRARPKSSRWSVMARLRCWPPKTVMASGCSPTVA